MPDAPTSFATPAELSAYTAGLIAADDDRSQVILDGATAAIRNFVGWNIAPAEDLVAEFDGPTRVLYIPTLQLNSVDSVTVDGAVWDPSYYEVSKVTANLRAKPFYYFPDVWGGISVAYNGGYDEVPADVKQIILQVCAQALSSPTGATREQVGQVSMQWATTAPGVSGGLSLLQRDLAILGAYQLPKEA